MYKQIQSLETSQYAIQNRTNIDLELKFDANNTSAQNQPEAKIYQLKAKSDPVSIPLEAIQMGIVSV